MRKIVIISACAVMLVALGLVSCMQSSSDSNNSGDNGFIVEQTSTVDIDFDPLFRVNYDSPFVQKGLGTAKPEDYFRSDEWHNSTYLIQQNSKRLEIPIKDVFASLDSVKTRFVHKVAATSNTVVNAKVGDLIFIYSIEKTSTEFNKFYDYIIDGSSKYRFQIYAAILHGNGTIQFDSLDEQGKTKSNMITVNVSK